MILQPFTFDYGHLEANLFLLGDESRREGLLIDAGVFDPSVTAFAAERNLRITTILLTHLHPDHVDGVEQYAETWGAEVIAPAIPPNFPKARIVRPGEELSAAGFRFRVFQTSGHTPESISYYAAEIGICFVGDAIFAGAVGGTQDDAHHEEEIGHLRRSILSLPESTELFSGHGPATTVAIEKSANPFLQPGFTRLPR